MSLYYPKARCSYFVDIIKTQMESKRYSFISLGTQGYNLLFKNVSFSVHFSARHQNVEIVMIKDNKLDHSSKVVLSTQQAEELFLGYKQMCIAHGIHTLKSSQRVDVNTKRDQRFIQNHFKQMKHEMSQNNRESLASLFA